MDSTPQPVVLVIEAAVGNPEAVERIPTGTPERTPPKRKDKRPTLTLKGEEFGPEFRALVNKAAEKAGMTQAAFVAETLTAAAQRVLKGTPPDAPQDTPPPPALSTARLDEQDRRLAEIAEQVKTLARLADDVRMLTEMRRRTIWQRVRAMFAPVVAASDM